MTTVALGSGEAKRTCWPKAVPAPQAQVSASSASRPPVGGLQRKIALPGSCRILLRRYNCGLWFARGRWNHRTVEAGNTNVWPCSQGENAKLEGNS